MRRSKESENEVFGRFSGEVSAYLLTPILLSFKY